MQDMTPVFICGYQKSGTTLLLSLLDNHPELLVYPEEMRFFKYLSDQPERLNPDYVLTQTTAKNFQMGKVGGLMGQRDFSSISFEQFSDTLRKKWEASDKSERAMYESIILSYGEATAKTNRKYWVEKSPRNENYLDKLSAWWPAARVLYIVRDPRDTYYSFRRKREASDSVLPRREFVATWQESVTNWQQFDENHPGKGLLIVYEELVHNAEREMRRVADFLQIAWDETLLLPTINGVFWAGNSMNKTEFKGISDNSIGKYRQALKSADIHYLEDQLGEIMDRYNYSKTCSGKMSFFEKLSVRVQDWMGK